MTKLNLQQTENRRQNTNSPLMIACFLVFINLT